MTDSLRVEILDAFQHLFKNNLSLLLCVVVNFFNLIHQLHTLSQLHHLVDFTFQLSLEHSFSLDYVNVI
jgi:hypothetical protein